MEQPGTLRDPQSGHPDDTSTFTNDLTTSENTKGGETSKEPGHAADRDDRAQRSETDFVETDEQTDVSDATTTPEEEA